MLREDGELFEQLAATPLGAVEEDERSTGLRELGVEPQGEEQGVLHGTGTKSAELGPARDEGYLGRERTVRGDPAQIVERGFGLLEAGRHDGAEEPVGRSGIADTAQ